MSHRTRIILFLIGLTPIAAFLIWSYFRPLGILGSADEIKDIVLSYGFWSPAAIIILQVIQVIITPIAQFAVGTASGFIFGLWGGFALNWIGRVIGHIIVFHIARYVGRPLVKKIIGIETLSKYDNFIAKGGPVALGLMFFMPLFPDDELSYIAGISSMARKPFLIAALIGHIGGSFGSALLGAGLADRNPVLIWLYGFAFVAVFSLWFFKKRMDMWIKKFGSEHKT